MSRTPRLLWAIAAASSLAAHAAVGMVLYAMPMPEAEPQKQTEITIQTVEDGTATRIASTTEISAIAPEATAAASDLGQTLAPSAVVAETIAPISTQSDRAAAIAVPPPLLAIDTGEKLAATAERAEPIEPVAIQPGLAASAVAPGLDPVQDRGSVPSPIHENANAELSAPAPMAALSESAAIAAAAVGSPAQQRSDRDSVVAAAANGADVQPAQPGIAAPVPAPPVLSGLVMDKADGSISALAPSDGPFAKIPGIAATASIAASAPLAASRPAAPVMVAIPTVNGTLAGAPSEPMIAAPAAIVPPGSTVLSPSGGSTALEAIDTEVAMLPRPDAITGDAASLAPQGRTPGHNSSRLRIAEFLAEQKDAAECVVAVPTGVGLQQASISAFADAPEKVARLGDEYERRSGVDLRAHTQAVSQPQCGALAFARDLAQYPNFPIALTLSPPSIGSGQELAGVISGLRKDTLYLMVVDDEGKAELVQSYTGLRVNVMPFHAPMTLTSGPVSTVQLLVAIASNGPLQSVPTHPGLPADEYFSRLKGEIISDQRSIDFGITGFVVR